MSGKRRGGRRSTSDTRAADVGGGAASVEPSALPPEPERGESVAREADPPIASEDEKEARIRQLEARVAELAESGEKASAEAASAITLRQQSEKTLYAANLLLAEADRRKHEFLAAFSHELRNGLAPIKNSLYILGRATSESEQARRAQAVIERQLDGLGRLVDDLLDVTRIARNKIKLQPKRLELNGLVRHTMDAERSLFDKAEVHLEFHPAPRPVLVDADWNRLAQVIANLLQNAAKFTARGGATLVTVHAERAEQRAIIQVVDTGVGIAPELLPCLFQPFTPADSSLDRSKGGLGLGLALVKGLVDLHEGQVTAHSAGLDQGAEFTVQLPLAIGEAVPAQVGSESPAKIRRRVLVIEDNIDAADSLCEVLALGEHEVVMAHNGPLGIARAREFRPEVVLCKISLPGMDGYEVARAFKADESLKNVFLVALSDSTLPEDLQRASEAGFERHLASPPSLEKLEELLAQVP
ncbi:MAG TPA: hybrid sensor histidine kinase/response regulator [Polyangia bacterium]|jgi:Signal transduction histidine kinase|nr:hybrid sensor histidine kinase/response regulator [Polyangia bacterium]